MGGGHVFFLHQANLFSQFFFFLISFMVWSGLGRRIIVIDGLVFFLSVSFCFEYILRRAFMFFGAVFDIIMFSRHSPINVLCVSGLLLCVPFEFFLLLLLPQRKKRCFFCLCYRWRMSGGEYSACFSFIHGKEG
jgi:hypothetical protein